MKTSTEKDRLGLTGKERKSRDDTLRIMHYGLVLQQWEVSCTLYIFLLDSVLYPIKCSRPTSPALSSRTSGPGHAVRGDDGDDVRTYAHLVIFLLNVHHALINVIVTLYIFLLDSVLYPIKRSRPTSPALSFRTSGPGHTVRGDDCDDVRTYAHLAIFLLIVHHALINVIVTGTYCVNVTPRIDMY